MCSPTIHCPCCHCVAVALSIAIVPSIAIIFAAIVAVVAVSVVTLLCLLLPLRCRRATLCHCCHAVHCHCCRQPSCRPLPLLSRRPLLSIATIALPLCCPSPLPCPSPSSASPLLPLSPSRHCRAFNCHRSCTIHYCCHCCCCVATAPSIAVTVVAIAAVAVASLTHRHLLLVLSPLPLLPLRCHRNFHCRCRHCRCRRCRRVTATFPLPSPLRQSLSTIVAFMSPSCLPLPLLSHLQPPPLMRRPSPSLFCRPLPLLPLRAIAPSIAVVAVRSLLRRPSSSLQSRCRCTQSLSSLALLFPCRHFCHVIVPVAATPTTVELVPTGEPLLHHLPLR